MLMGVANILRAMECICVCIQSACSVCMCDEYVRACVYVFVGCICIRVCIMCMRVCMYDVYITYLCTCMYISGIYACICVCYVCTDGIFMCVRAHIIIYMFGILNQYFQCSCTVSLAYVNVRPCLTLEHAYLSAQHDRCCLSFV